MDFVKLYVKDVRCNSSTTLIAGVLMEKASCRHVYAFLIRWRSGRQRHIQVGPFVCNTHTFFPNEKEATFWVGLFYFRLLRQGN